MSEVRAANSTEGLGRFKPYPALKESGVEWLGEIPTHWEVRRLKTIATKIGSGKTPSGGGEVYVDTGVMLIRSQNVHFAGLHLDDVAFIDAATDREMASSRLNKGDVLLNITGASLGRCCVATLNGPANVNQHVCIIRSRAEATDSSFLASSLASAPVQAQIFNNEAGISRDALNFEQVGELTVAIPPLKEQHAIATFLDSGTTKTDALVAKKERLIELLEEKGAALITRAVTKGLDPNVRMKDSGSGVAGENPVHWETAPLKRFVHPVAGSIKTGPFGSQLLSSEMQGGQVKVYNQRTVIDRDFVIGDNFISEEKFKDLASFAVQPGDVLVTTRGTIGRCAGCFNIGPDACAEDAGGLGEMSRPYGDVHSGGYRRRHFEDYDRALCLLPRDVMDFVLATQPKEWEKLTQHHGAAVREQFLQRLATEIERRGALDVLRNGIKDSGCRFQLAYFRPASGLNEETRRLHAANLFAVVRQLRYSEKNENSLDLVLFLNGIPIFTAELKNPLTGQTSRTRSGNTRPTAIRASRSFAYGRCLAHFAVDPDLVYVTTQLAGQKTRFLPFNQGKFGGAGNPPVPPTQKGYATAYLWEETWARDSVLDLVRQFIHEVEEEDDKGRKTGKRFLIFPRYQQLDAVRKLVADARAQGRGAALPDPALGRQRQELHHRLARAPALHTARRLRPARFRLDRGHHRPARPRPPAPDHDAPVRADARRGGEHRHHVAPAQGGTRDSARRSSSPRCRNFPVIAKEIGELPGKRFAVIVDEAHSSQSGESTKSLKAVLAVQVAGGGGARGGPGAKLPRKSSRARSSPRWRSAAGFRTSRPSPSPPRPSRRRLSSSASSAPTGSSRPSTSTACARRSRRASSSTCSQTTRPTRPIGAC